jgi:hypothetical protein
VLHAHVASDFRDDDRYFDTALDLMLGLYSIPPRHPAAMHWKQQLSVGEFQRKVRAQDVGDDEPLLDNEVMQNALKRVGREALTSAFNAQKPMVIEQNEPVGIRHIFISYVQTQRN